MLKKSIVVALAALLSGCGWSTFDREQQYLEAETIKRVEIPPGLDQPDFQDALVIPEARDVRDLAGQKVEVGLPEPLAASGVDQIVIKRLGDTRWVFVDAPPAMVWPRLRQFWAQNNLPLEFADPSRGVMETEWLTGREGDAELVFESFKTGQSWTASASHKHKFRLTIEPGIRAGSTEVYIEHKRLPLGGPVLDSAIEWGSSSDDHDLEATALTEVAYYLGERINTATQVSKLATNIGGERALLVPDSTKPVLKYKLKFDRAWVTVGDALEEAQINVEGTDRDAATYSIYFDERNPDEPGFFSRLFSGDEEGESPEHRYLVHLENQLDEVHVTVMKDATTVADALVAERLLKIIKQYST